LIARSLTEASQSLTSGWPARRRRRSPIEAAFNRYSVLVFPDQPVSDEQQLDFGRLFGPLEVNPN
jgi:alpha-ketoglutarate-dependent 2,4-dichlorophenoxyacetate dioxygenase